MAIHRDRDPRIAALEERIKRGLDPNAYYPNNRNETTVKSAESKCSDRYGDENDGSDSESTNCGIGDINMYLVNVW